MAPPPAKRRKRNVVHDSDDDEGKPANTLTNFLLSSPSSKITSSNLHSRGPTTSPSPTKERARPTNASQSTISSSLPRTLQNQDSRSASNSPEKPKPRSKKRVKTEEKGKSADLLTLFSKQAQKAPTRPRAPTKTNSVDDIISDPISDSDDGDDIADKKTSSTSIVGKIARRRLGDRSSHVGTGSALPLNSSQKFLKPPRPYPPATVDDDLRPWAERFAPVNLEELAVHKKKVADVRRWLEDVMAGRMRQRLLILKGAAGSGKTTTMRLLARDLGYELLEWRNPTVALAGNTGFQSASAQFQEFLGRGGHFGQLDTDVESSEPSPGGSSGKPPGQSLRRVILIEEFPNTFARSSSALTSFRNTILDYLATNTPALSTFGRQPLNKPITPVIMIISETLLTTTSASADSFTAHRLLGPEILRHPGTGIIEFNPIAPSILSKALELVVVKEARKSGRRRTPGPLVLKRLGEIGDIRSAISSLEFLCLKGDQEADWGAKVAFTKPKKGARDGVALTKGEEESLELVSQREASLGVFHAVGKVVYNKRDEQPPPGDTVKVLPSYMAQHARPNRSQVSIDKLMDETGTDTHTFVSALHENYVLSCESQNPRDLSSPLDYVNGCIEYLSQSDLLCPSWDVFFGGRGYAAGFAGKDSGSHVLRQDEMTFQVAVRGLLFSLPFPVKRKAPTGARGSDAFKMFYPTSIKLWRSKEEMEGMVDLWSTKLLKGEESVPWKDVTQGAAAFRRPRDMGAGSSSSGGSRVAAAQQSKGSSAAASAAGQRDPSDAGGGGSAPPLLSLGSAARREMLLERLPYMAQIARGGKGVSFHALKLREIEKVVSFRGIGPEQGADESGDEAVAEGEESGVMTGEAWATDKPSEESTPRKKVVGIRTRSDGSVSGLGMQSLVISDDDIEDDWE